jgi:hypothetical protein
MPDAVLVSVGPLVRIDGLRGSVHAVFPRSVYLEPETGPLIVLHGPEHGHTPTSLIVAGTHRDGWGARVGDTVSGRLGHLRVGRVLFDGRQAGVWRAPAPSRRGFAAAPWCERMIDDAATARLQPACRWLGAALLAGNAAAVDDGVAALVGNGPGLTPAGDDALVGLLALLHRVGPPSACARLLRLLDLSVNARLARTTPISAHYLHLALLGHTGERLTGLVDALGEDGVVDAASVARVRATGASSGADALAGVAAGLRLLRGISASSTHQVKETA